MADDREDERPDEEQVENGSGEADSGSDARSDRDAERATAGSSSGGSDAAGSAGAAGSRARQQRQQRRDQARERANTAKRPTSKGGQRRSLPKRVMRFLREVVGELRKVIWPTRRELVTYTAVVLVFVSFVIAYVAGLDLGITKGMFYIFAGN